MLTTLIFFLIAFGAVLLLEKLVHRRLQEVFLLLTGHMESATLLYSFALLPGVALHELSHAVAALLLGVKVRGFSLRAQRQPSGVVRLGYVEVLRTDPVRTSLIGAAPLFFGIAALLAIGSNVFDLGSMASAIDAADPSAFANGLLAIFNAKDSFVWIYAVFAVANGMMPSKSDTQAWPPVVAGLGAVLAGIFALGGQTLLGWIAPGATATLNWLGGAFTVTAFINMIVIALLIALARMLERVTGRKVTFHR
jgi:hypothetical protein